MSDISERLLFTHGGANKLVGRLVDRKLVHRQRSESDQRVMTVKITDLGADVLSQAVPIMTETVESFWNQGLSKVDQEIFARLLKQLGLHYDD